MWSRPAVTRTYEWCHMGRGPAKLEIEMACPRRFQFESGAEYGNVKSGWHGSAELGSIVDTQGCEQRKIIVLRDFRYHYPAAWYHTLIFEQRHREDETYDCLTFPIRIKQIDPPPFRPTRFEPQQSASSSASVASSATSCLSEWTMLEPPGSLTAVPTECPPPVAATTFTRWQPPVCDLDP